MQVELVLALVFGIPMILFPVAFVWYLTIGGLVAVARQRETKRVTAAKGKEVAAR